MQPCDLARALADSLGLHVIEIPDGWGSQASLASGIIQTASAFNDADRLCEPYHDFSHLWNVRDFDVPPCRYNEGLAKVLQKRIDAGLRPAEALEPRTAEALEHLQRRVACTPELAQVPFIDSGSKDMTDHSYSTGELMFKLLYRVMGEASFDSALVGFLRVYGRSGSTTEELADYLQRRSPGSVEHVLKDWLFTCRWAERVSGSEALSAMIASYR